MTLSWSAAHGVRPIEFYTLFRDGKPLAQTASLTLKDEGLKTDTLYSYFVSATDAQGNQSLPSTNLNIKTAGGVPDPQYPEWQLNHHYRKDDGVTYQGNLYLCLQEHTSNAGWTPDVAFTLWAKVAVQRRA